MTVDPASAVAEDLLDDWVRAGRESERTPRLESSSPESLPDPVPLGQLKEGPPPRFLVDGLIPEREFGAIVGDDGSMKTTLAIVIAVAVASGSPLFGRTVRAGDVLLVNEEDSPGVVANRARAIALGMGVDENEVAQGIHVLAREGFSLDDEGWRAHVARWIDARRPSLVILDPYAELTLAAENSNDDAKPNIRWFRELTDLGAAVVLAHHFGKPSEGKAKADRIRGASALRSACRFVYAVERKQGGRLSLECLKMSRAERPDPLVITYEIEADPGNRAVWTSARFDAVERTEVERADAELAVLDAIYDEPGILAGELKKVTSAAGISPLLVNRVKGQFERRGIIDVEPGERGARHHYLSGVGKARRVSLRSTRHSEGDAGNAGSPGIPGIQGGMPGQKGGVSDPASLSRESAGAAACSLDRDADSIRDAGEAL